MFTISFQVRCSVIQYVFSLFVRISSWQKSKLFQNKQQSFVQQSWCTNIFSSELWIKKKNNFFFTALINCSAILQYIFSALHPFNALILYSVKQAVTLKNLALIVPWKPLYNMKNFTGSAYFCREVFSK